MEVTKGMHMSGGFSLSGFKAKASELLDRIGRHEVFMMAGSLAYTTALALAPFIIIMLSIAALLGQGAQDRLYSQMTSMLGPQAGDAIRLVVENADKNPKISGISGLIGVLILAVSASTIFTQLRATLDKIDEREPGEASSGIWGFIKDKFLSVGLVFGFVFLAITSLTVTAAISVLFSGGEQTLWNVVAFFGNLVVFSVLFTAIFRFIPSQRLPWKRAFKSGVCGAVFFLIGKALIGLYLGNASVGSSYGAAGTLVVFLVWVYYTTLTLLISYEFTNSVILDESEGERRYT